MNSGRIAHFKKMKQYKIALTHLAFEWNLMHGK